MKRKISLLITAALAAAPFTVPAQAADYEKTLLEVKERIELPAQYSKFDFRGESTYDGKTEYSFEWSDPSDDEANPIRVSCMEDGTVIRYNFYEDVDEHDYLNADTEKSAVEAEKFITRLNPQLDGKLRLEIRNGYMYGPLTLTVYGVYDGIEYYRSIGTVDITSKGKIIHMSIDAPDAEDIAAAKISKESCINGEEAYKLYMERIGTEVSYMTYTDDDDKTKSFPVYRNKAFKAIDAVTGDAIDYANDDYAVYNTASGMKEAAADSGRGLSEQELGEIAKINNLITRDKAVAVINERLGISVSPDNIELNGRGTSYIYYINSENINATVNASNGDILSVYIYSGEEKKNFGAFDKYDISDSAQAAALLKLLAPSDGPKYTDNYEYQSEDKDESASFEYRVNNIPVEEAGAYVSKRAKSVYFNIDSLDKYEKCEYTDPSEFKAPEDVVDKDDIMLRLVETEDGIKAAYISDDYMVSAVTGKAVNYKGEEVTDDGSGYTYSDIDGHWVKSTAQKLAIGGIGFSGGELKPDQAITKKEAQELLNRIYYRSEKKPEEGTLTRLETAKLIVNMLDLEKLSKADIFVQPYKDTASDFGAVAILKGMGVISSDADMFRPDAPATRAEFLQMLYNIMQIK